MLDDPKLRKLFFFGLTLVASAISSGLYWLLTGGQ
jgi:hypothetical protein